MRARWECLHAEALAAVIRGERAIETRVDLDAQAGIAASTGSGLHLEEAPSKRHGVVVLDHALVLETTDAVEVCLGRRRSPRGRGVRGCMREVGVVAREEPVQDALRLREGTRVGEPEFDDQAILEGAEEPFDTALGFRGMGADPADAEFLEGAADLGRFGPTVQLLGQGERGAGITVKDPVAVRVGGTGQAVPPDELTEEQEVALGIFLQAEDPTEDFPGGVIDGSVQDEPRPAVFEPGVVAAVHLDQEAGLRHALAAAPMAGWAAGPGTANAGGAKQPLHGLAREAERLAVPQQFGEVMIVGARVSGAGEGEDAGPDSLRQAA